MTPSDRYIEETRDKKPRRKDFVNAAEYYIATIDWYESFSIWLSARLEKAEEENRELKLRIEGYTHDDARSDTDTY